MKTDNGARRLSARDKKTGLRYYLNTLANDPRLMSLTIPYNRTLRTTYIWVAMTESTSLTHTSRLYNRAANCVGEHSFIPQPAENYTFHILLLA